MKKTIIAALTAVVCGLSAMAQEKNPSDTVALPQDVQMMRVAGELVKYGYDKSQALPLIQAVEIYQAVGEGNFDGEKTNSESATKDSSVSYDINQIIADAAELADGDPNLVALVENLKNKATRGATSNYAVHRDCVRANSSDEYRIQFRGGETAIVVVSGDGDTDLDLYVYDRNGNLVCSDTDYSDDCVAVWNPRYTQTYTIKIKNRGKIANVYRMAVN